MTVRVNAVHIRKLMRSAVPSRYALRAFNIPNIMGAIRSFLQGTGSCAPSGPALVWLQAQHGIEPIPCMHSVHCGSCMCVQFSSLRKHDVSRTGERGRLVLGAIINGVGCIVLERNKGVTPLSVLFISPVRIPYSSKNWFVEVSALCAIISSHPSPCITSSPCNNRCLRFASSIFQMTDPMEGRSHGIVSSTLLPLICTF